MGLDMYLSVRKKDWKEKIPEKYLDYNEIADQDKFIQEMGYENIVKLILSKNIFLGTQLYTNIVWMSLTQEIGYWRKANAIHNWFVKNVQNGVDDCGYYVVTKKQLEELLEICIKVRDSLNNQKPIEKINKDGFAIKVFENHEIAQNLLPALDGFFFGGIEYDEYYLESIQETIGILLKATHWVDEDNFEILYHSSW